MLFAVSDTVSGTLHVNYELILLLTACKQQFDIDSEQSTYARGNEYNIRQLAPNPNLLNLAVITGMTKHSAYIKDVPKLIYKIIHFRQLLLKVNNYI